MGDTGSDDAGQVMEADLGDGGLVPDNAGAGDPLGKEF
jgi:hypothetical protein